MCAVCHNVPCDTSHLIVFHFVSYHILSFSRDFTLHVLHILVKQKVSGVLISHPKSYIVSHHIFMHHLHNNPLPLFFYCTFPPAHDSAHQGLILALC